MLHGLSRACGRVCCAASALLLALLLCPHGVDARCGGETTAPAATDAEQTLGDGSGAGSNYPSDCRGRWKITAPAGTRIALRFTRFRFEHYDWVELYNGFTVSAGARMGTGDNGLTAVARNCPSTSFLTRGTFCRGTDGIAAAAGVHGFTVPHSHANLPPTEAGGSCPRATRCSSR